MIALVTDSTAPLTHAEAEKYGICVVPHSYTVDGTAYLENYTDENPGYTDRLSRASAMQRPSVRPLRLRRHSASFWRRGAMSCASCFPRA